MKTGDLVKMKPELLKPDHLSIQYTDLCGIVYSVAGRGIKVLMPNNTIKLGLIDHWEVLSLNVSD